MTKAELIEKGFSSEHVCYPDETIAVNQALIERYPFLQPRNRLSDEIDCDYAFTYTELDAMPYGWRKAFGHQMLEEIRAVLVRGDYLNQYRIFEIKEKYGTLRWYDGGAPEAIFDELQAVIDKYEDMSMLYCLNCGKPTKYKTKRWVSYLCPDCATHRDVVLLGENDIPRYYSKDGNKESLLADRMKKQWRNK